MWPREATPAPAELPALLAAWKQELAQLDAAADLAALEAAEKKAHGSYVSEARTVSKARAKAAPQLAKAVTAAMQGVGMQGGRFDVQLQTLAEPQQSGMEEVAFLVAGHAGSTPRPVGKVASGGELSRIALALKTCLAASGAGGTRGGSSGDCCCNGAAVWPYPPAP